MIANLGAFQGDSCHNPRQFRRSVDWNHSNLWQLLMEGFAGCVAAPAESGERMAGSASHPVDSGLSLRCPA